MFGPVNGDHRPQPFMLLAAAMLALLVLISPCPGDESSPRAGSKSATGKASEKSRPTPPPAKPANSVAVKPMTAAEREAAAIAFAREHHPELATLVEKLRTDNRREFDKAIRELTMTRDRLSRLEKQARPQYELALKAWKLDSRANLLAARMTVSNDPALESALKRILRERVDVRLDELQAERGRLEKRLGNVRTMIQNIEADREAASARDLQRVKRTVVRNRRPLTKKPATLQTKPAMKPVIAKRPQKLPQTPEQVSQPPGIAQPHAD